MLARLVAPIFRLARGDHISGDSDYQDDEYDAGSTLEVTPSQDALSIGISTIVPEGARSEGSSEAGGDCLSCDIAALSSKDKDMSLCAEQKPASQPSVSELSLITSPGPQLPVELLYEIFVLADRQALATLALSSHTFHDISTRLLYRHIPFLSLPQSVRCLRTLSRNALLASYTLSFEIGDMDSLDLKRTGSVLGAFFGLLARAFRNMTRLTELSYLLFGPTSASLVDAPFKLTNLTASCDFDPSFATFLTEQRSLQTALFCGRYITGTSVDFNALPALNRVSASPLVLASVVPGRPVREVELCLVHPWLLNADILETTVQIMSYSKGPLRSLQIISHLTGPADIILNALAAVPKGLSGLEILALHAVSGSINNDLLVGLKPILAQFVSLKSLILISKNQYDAVHDHIITKTLASTWHAACASLECVSLPHATWVRNRKYGWVTLQDLERLLLEREQTLMNREKKVREREEVLDQEQRSLIEREHQLEAQIRELRLELGM
ncbi:hypothetical protein EVG20_g4254 [Dentipellis fragilis]|uniref:F-box domain-containing protein n=1 Tax=Dentipellis fragilis TaxID=205917 RepID=A0A4Y9YZ40_9AGAM|nr:hypothetical protein EVG20_g4254 [Dentipellis fragilis]